MPHGRLTQVRRIPAETAAGPENGPCSRFGEPTSFHYSCETVSDRILLILMTTAMLLVLLPAAVGLAGVGTTTRRTYQSRWVLTTRL